MARIVDVGTLRTAINDELNRPEDDDTTIDGFIQRAEASIRRIGRAVQKQGGGQAFFAKDNFFANIDTTGSVGTDIVETVSAHLRGTQETSGISNPITNGTDPRTRRQLDITYLSNIVDLIGKAHAVAGPPTHISFVGKTGCNVAPIPDDNYAVSLDLLVFPELDFQVTTSTHDLLTDAPDLYLYGSLRAAATFFKEEERLPMWSQLFHEATAELDLQYERMKFPSALDQPLQRAFGARIHDNRY